MAQRHVDKSRHLDSDSSFEAKGKTNSLSSSEDFDPLSITNGGDGGAFEDDAILDVSDSQTDFSNSAQSSRRAGASGGLDTDQLSQGLNESVQKIGETFDSAKSKISTQFGTLKDGVKSKASHLGTSAKAGAKVASEGIKKGAATADVQIRANPYLFAFAAVGVGFIIGRLLPSIRNAKGSSAPFKDYQTKPYEHTGIHVSSENQYTGS